MSDSNQLSEIERLKTENANLRAQLDQTLEELRYYFDRYQKFQATETLPGATDATQPSTREASPDKSDVVAAVDMRHLIDGDNWYKPEADGRWAGPGKVSIVRIPSALPGRYSLEIKIVGAMAPEIVDQMHATFDEAQVSFDKIYKAPFDGVFAPFKKWAIERFYPAKAFPAVLYGAVSIDTGKPNQPHTLEMTFPETISPASSGATDGRQLAIRVGEIRLRRLAG